MSITSVNIANTPQEIIINQNLYLKNRGRHEEKVIAAYGWVTNSARCQ